MCQKTNEMAQCRFVIWLTGVPEKELRDKYIGGNFQRFNNKRI